MNAFGLSDIAPGQLNSATKYPSIPTYHTLLNDGGLTDPAIDFTDEVIGTEKVDGCNVRIVFMPDGSFVIGTREEFLFATGDYLSNGVHGIVDDLVHWALDWKDVHSGGGIQVFYGEYYGGKGITPASKQYTAANRSGFRLFDVAFVDDPAALAGWSLDRISSWREHGGLRFLHEDELVETSGRADMELTPRLFRIDATELPRDVERTHQWLAEHAPRTRVALDEGAQGRAEGIVLRTPDRSVIAKLRFQNYNRTRQLRDRTAAR